MAVGVKTSGVRTNKLALSRKRRHIRVRKKVSGSATRPRLVVTRSARHVFVQVVDDVVGKTLASASTMESDLRAATGDKTAKSREVGKLEFALGFSHPVVITPPEGITFKVETPTKFHVEGIDKQKVGEVAANIRKLRKPDPYKGKGVRYSGEVVRRKVGKAGK